MQKIILGVKSVVAKVMTMADIIFFKFQQHVYGYNPQTDISPPFINAD